MARQLIGTAVTNENGVATITYTGTGAGKLNIVAESGTFVSETYEVLDCFCYDGGTNGNHSDAMWQYSTNVNVVRGTEDTTVTNNHTSHDYLTANIIGTSSDYYDFDTPFCVEFDFEKVNSSDVNTQIQFFDTANNNWRRWIETKAHYKFNITGSRVEWYIDDQRQGDGVVDLGKCLVRFYIQSGASFKFKDFKIYPI